MGKTQYKRSAHKVEVVEHFGVSYKSMKEGNVLLEVVYEITFNNKRNKFTSTQLVSVLSLILQHVSTSEGHTQSSSIKYVKGIVYSCTKFCTGISDLQFDKVHFSETKFHRLNLCFNI
jgi:hypothetical protein